MYKTFLIKYAEIAIKGKNRYVFEDALVKNIRYQLKNVEGDFVVRKESGRVYVDANSEYDFDEVVSTLQRVFGIVGICPVVQTDDEGFDKLAADVIAHI
ncbi:MAG: tRNA 4-thiouridine(8) synthase ThiI, partial [Agathobacter sp.]|nr:tRNA 4-thiouridine(8) synthase ThiI [Agathobacter sp.]